MVDVSNSTVYSPTDASNNSAITLPGWAEGMNPSGVNDSARALQGAIRRLWERTGPFVTSGGSANAQTLTLTAGPLAYVKGDVYACILGFSNSGATTLNVNALGAVNILMNGGSLVGGELRASSVAAFAYDGTSMHLIWRSAGIVSSSLQSNILGTAGGSKTAPSTTNTNLLFHFISSTNWTGIGDDTAGSLYFVTGNSGSAAATRMVIDGSGNVQINNYGAGALKTDASGNVTTGTLPLANGGTAATTAAGAFANIISGSTVAVGNGGTAATTAAGAFANLISGSTVAVGNGGTGATSAANAFANIAVAASSLATPGFIKFQNGLFIQWGILTLTSPTQTYPVTFPTAFVTNNPFAVVTSVVQGDLTSVIASPESITKTGFTFNISATANSSGYWIAIGN